VVPKLQAAGWDADPHSIAEQRTFTDGRIFPLKDGRAKRGKPKRADYLLRYTRDFTVAVVEAKADYRSAADGLQQAKQYAEIPGSDKRACLPVNSVSTTTILQVGLLWRLG
jgi:type I restriction enzyme R subunit